MKIEFFGSGGAIRTPRPGCMCRVCVEARQKGPPYSRSGPGLYVHGPDVLIDTSEDIYLQVNRTDLQFIPNCIYSHWHPDHTMGRRLWETMNLDMFNWPPQSTVTQIYLPQQVAEDFRTRLGNWEHMTYLRDFLRVVKVNTVADGETFTLNDVTVRPFRLAEDYVYAFIFEGEAKRVLIAPDELNDWQPPADLGRFDLAVIPMGIPELNPLTGERVAAEGHPIYRVEASFEETLDMVRQLDAGRVIMTHIEERCGMTYDDFLMLEEKLTGEGLPISFAYDTRIVEV